jgi:four helix bundle protein
MLITLIAIHTDWVASKPVDREPGRPDCQPVSFFCRVFTIDQGNLALYVCVMHSYRDLEIYRESRNLAIDIHMMSLMLPKFEQYETGGQIRRSSKSVTSMIVEGFARRRYKPDFVKYLIYSIAECDETLVHLDFLFDTQSLKDEKRYDELRSRVDRLSKQINKFTQWVEQQS